MDRRRFLQIVAAGASTLNELKAFSEAPGPAYSAPTASHGIIPAGRVDFRIAPRGENQLGATIALPEKGELPARIQVSFRLPEGKSPANITVNSRAVEPGGPRKDAVIFDARGERTFQVIARHN